VTGRPRGVLARPPRHSARRRLGGGCCRRSASRARVRCIGYGDVAREPTGQRVCASGACGAAQDHGCAHRGGRDRRLWAHPAAPPGGNLGRIAWVLFGRIPVHGVHGAGRTQDAAMPSCAQRAANPYQVQRHATATISPSREGATAVRKGAGAACIWRWSRLAPS
jgi:hypothetical protein